MKSYRKFIRLLTNVVYSIGCLALYMVAGTIIASALIGFSKELFASQFTINRLLDEIGLIIFAIAVIDIAKYLLQEEVLRGSDERNFKEIRRTLTKVISIVSTALFLKGLILTMEASAQDPSRVVYSLMVLISPVFLITGVGIYHFFSKGDT